MVQLMSVYEDWRAQELKRKIAFILSFVGV
jgi:hypothetical protein